MDEFFNGEGVWMALDMSFSSKNHLNHGEHHAIDGITMDISLDY